MIAGNKKSSDKALKTSSSLKKEDKVARMGTASIPGLILEFSIPSILGMLVNGAYNIISAVFLGQAIGEIGLSTTTVAMPIMALLMALAMWVGNGGNALAALRMGEGDRDAANRSLGNTVTLALIIAVFVAIAVRIPACLNALLGISGATAENWEYSRSFVLIISTGFIFQCIGMGVNNFIRTSGAPNRALSTMVIGSVACIILNYLFVMVFGWGVQGSALATVLGQAVSCACVLWYFIVTKNTPLKLHWRSMALRAQTVKLIMSLGLASFAVQIGGALVNFVLNNLLSYFGAMSPLGAEGALASIGVVQRIAMFSTFPLIGISVAVQPLLGFNYGAHFFDRVVKALWDGIFSAMGIGVFMWALVHLFPEQIIGFFGIVNGDLRNFTEFALKVQLFMLPLVGFQIVGANFFQATGRPAKAIFLTLTRQIIFLIPLFFILPSVLPVWFPQFNCLDALYFAAPVADFFAIFVTAVFVIKETRRLKKLALDTTLDTTNVQA